MIKQTYDDNLLYSETNTRASWGTSLSPAAEFKIQKNQQSASLSYRIDKTIYTDSLEDNFLDHFLRSDLNLRFSERSSMNLFASYINGHEARGTGFSQRIGEQLSEADKLRHYQTGAAITYGTTQSLGRIKLQINALADRLDNRPEAARFANQNSYSGIATFYYKIRVSLSLLFEAYLAKNLFPSLSDSETLDNNENRYYIGGTWNVSTLTTGTVKIGMIKKQFQNQDQEPSLSPSWDININWRPFENMQLQFNTSSYTQETTGFSNYTDVIDASTNLIQQWTPVIQTIITAGVKKSVYQPTNQEEGLWNIGINMEYLLRRWLTLGIGMVHQERLSTIINQDYRRNSYIISLLLTT